PRSSSPSPRTPSTSSARSGGSTSERALRGLDARRRARRRPDRPRDGPRRRGDRQPPPRRGPDDGDVPLPLRRRVQRPRQPPHLAPDRRAVTTLYRAGQGDTTDCRAWVEVDGRRRPLYALVYGMSRRRWRIDPQAKDAFAYGYLGTGPTALARAILAHAMGLGAFNRHPDREALTQSCK